MTPLNPLNFVDRHHDRPVCCCHRIVPGKHVDTQFWPLLDCFAKPKNDARLAAKLGGALGQAHITVIRDPELLLSNNSIGYVYLYVFWYQVAG